MEESKNRDTKRERGGKNYLGEGFLTKIVILKRNTQEKNANKGGGLSEKTAKMHRLIGTLYTKDRKQSTTGRVVDGGQPPVEQKT